VTRRFDGARFFGACFRGGDAAEADDERDFGLADFRGVATGAD
jgi:hypothetical protein